MTRRAHLAPVLLMLIAVSLLACQPICEADEVHYYDDPAGSCPSLGPAAPAQSPAVTGSEGAGFAIAGAVAASSAVGAQAFEAAGAMRFVALPVPRYYARSARIQR